MMENSMFLVLLVTSCACFLITSAFNLSTTIPCPSYCTDTTCQLGVGCTECRYPFNSKYYGGYIVGYICVGSCPSGYMRSNGYCIN